ncbi:hypothetical protein ALON55S_00761 [Alishewanella longhuensis]
MTIKVGINGFGRHRPFRACAPPLTGQNLNLCRLMIRPPQDGIALSQVKRNFTPLTIGASGIHLLNQQIPGI